MSYKNMVHKLTTKDLNERLRDKLENALLINDYWKEQKVRDSVWNFIYRLEDKLADSHYCILILSTLHNHGATCEIFEKNWKPIAKLAEEVANL